MYVESTRFNQLEISPNLPIVWFFSSFEDIASWDVVISPGKRKNEPEKACKEYNFIINSRCWKYITSATDLDEIALLHLLPGWNDIIISAGAVSLKVIHMFRNASASYLQEMFAVLWYPGSSYRTASAPVNAMKAWECEGVWELLVSNRMMNRALQVITLKLNTKLKLKLNFKINRLFYHW